MTKHRKPKSKRQKGGDGQIPEQPPGQSISQPPSSINNSTERTWGSWFPTSGFGSWFSSAESKAKEVLNSANDAIGNAASKTYEGAQSLISSPSSNQSSTQPSSNQSSTQPINNYIGGKNKKGTRKKNV